MAWNQGSLFGQGDRLEPPGVGGTLFGAGAADKVSREAPASDGAQLALGYEELPGPNSGEQDAGDAGWRKDLGFDQFDLNALQVAQSCRSPSGKEQRRNEGWCSKMFFT